MFEVCKGKTCADFSAGLLKQVDVPLTASLTPEAPCEQTFLSFAADQLHIYTKSITKRTVTFTALSCTSQRRNWAWQSHEQRTPCKGFQGGTQETPPSLKIIWKSEKELRSCYTYGKGAWGKYIAPCWKVNREYHSF